MTGYEFSVMQLAFNRALAACSVPPRPFHPILQDERSFLQIAYLNYSNTAARSVTLLAGPCRPNSTDAYAHPAAPLTAGAAAAAVGGCAVRAVDNSTLVPTLRRDAAVATLQPLLVIITSNVSLGAGLYPGSISILRPVVIAGLRTRPTSVDLGMVVNQINVTAPTAMLRWQSVIFENAAPGKLSRLGHSPLCCWFPRSRPPALLATAVDVCPYTRHTSSLL